MTILLIHFSDIHIGSDKDPILGRVSSIRNALRADLAESDDILLVTSGDIAYSGEATQYDLAIQFFGELEKEILAVSKSDRLTYLAVPGNHDCCFEGQLHADTREQVIQDIAHDHQLLQNASLISDCLEPMENYFNSCSPVLSSGVDTGDERFVFERVLEFSDNTKIRFIGYNTAWMSLPGKGHGDILFPIHLIPSATTDESIDLVFSIMHHPYAWIRSDVSKAFREHVESVSNVVITGHEHDSSYRSTTYLHGETRQYVAGGELQDTDEQENSTFNTILLDSPNRRMRLAQHTWRDTLYSREESEWLDIPRSSVLRQDKFVLTGSSLQFLLEPGAPFTHQRKTDLSIDDIYVFPDMEELSDKPEGNLIPSAKTLDYLLSNSRIMVFGPESAGKTSLLKVMFRKHQQNDVVPLWVDGGDITTADPGRLQRLFSSAFKDAYGEQYLEDFWQLDPTKRALIIDDFQDVNLNRQAMAKLFHYLDNNFGIALISSSSIIPVQELVETEMSDFLLSCSRVILSEFGSVTRHNLIEKWLLLGQEDIIQEEELDNKLKQIDEKSRVILKPSVAPSYPFYILTIAQSVDNEGTAMPVLSKEDRGSFGFFYEWLITTSLHRNPKRIPDVSAKYRYLSDLAHHLYQEGRTSGDALELQTFHNSYLQKISLRHIDLPYEDMVADLRSSGLLRITNAHFEFAYPCVFYYFVARALNTRLQQPEHEADVKESISRLASQVDLDENENILLFISYLSENPYIRDTLMQTAKQMFSPNAPANLEGDVAFINKDDFNLVFELPDGRPRDVRASAYEEEDKQRRSRIGAPGYTHSEGASEEQAQFHEQLRAVAKAFKMVRVMGHLVKNFATTWEGIDKYPVTEEAYLLGLRAMKQVLRSLEQSFDLFIEHVKDTLRYGIEKEMLRIPPERRSYPTETQLKTFARATAFVRLLMISSNGLTAIARHVGMAQLYPIHQQVLDNHNSLLSVRLIDVAIKLDCQSQLPLNAMAELLDDLEGNHLAKAVLRNMAYRRMVLWESDRTDKQKCCRMLGIKENDPRLYSSRRRITRK